MIPTLFPIRAPCLPQQALQTRGAERLQVHVHRPLRTGRVQLRAQVHVHLPTPLHSGTTTTSSTTKVHMVTSSRRDTMRVARYCKQSLFAHFHALSTPLIELIFNCRVLVARSTFRKCRCPNLLGTRSRTCSSTTALQVGVLGLRMLLACHSSERRHFPLRRTSRYVHYTSLQ